jgi:hypothetical protein
MPAEGVTELLRSLDKGQPSRGEKTIFDAATLQLGAKKGEKARMHMHKFANLAISVTSFP